MPVVGAETHQTLSGVATGDMTRARRALRAARGGESRQRSGPADVRAREDRRVDRARCPAGVVRLAGRQRAERGRVARTTSSPCCSRSLRRSAAEGRRGRARDHDRARTGAPRRRASRWSEHVQATSSAPSRRGGWRRGLCPGYATHRGQEQEASQDRRISNLERQPAPAAAPAPPAGASVARCGRPAPAARQAPRAGRPHRRGVLSGEAEGARRLNRPARPRRWGRAVATLHPSAPPPSVPPSRSAGVSFAAPDTRWPDPRGGPCCRRWMPRFRT